MLSLYSKIYIASNWWIWQNWIL